MPTPMDITEYPTLPPKEKDFDLSQIHPILREISSARGLLVELYGDIAKPGVQQIGKAVSTILGTVNSILSPLELINFFVNETARANMEKYRVRMEKYRVNEIGLLAPEVAVPIIQKLFFVSDEELSSAFLNLLERASVEKECNKAHPSFVNILCCLSPDEARILRTTIDVGSCPYLVHVLDKEIPHHDRENNKSYIGRDSKTLGYYSGLEHKTSILFPNNMGAYLHNLAALGLVTLSGKLRTIENGVMFFSDEPYAQLKKIYSDQLCLGQLDKEGYISTTVDSAFYFTEYGRFFVGACLREPKAEHGQ